MTSKMLVDARTARPSFSFYLDHRDIARAERLAARADAVTLRGINGPRAVRALRQKGWTGAVLFDAAGYDPGKGVDPGWWIDAQVGAHADRLLTGGRYASWGTNGLAEVFDKEATVADRYGAIPLLALDYRWLTKGLESAIALFGSRSAPVAIVLGHRSDPLSAGGAVDGLVALIRTRPELMLLRADHGAVGALAYGATHAGLGLKASHRHLVPPGVVARRRPGDKSPRIFVTQLLDWFTGFTVASWDASDLELTCKEECCGGEPLARFLIERFWSDATRHNEVVLGSLADDILNAPPNDRRRRFVEHCRSAVDFYDRLGAVGLTPKPQLEAWTFLA
ncbi:MAG: hypothetical protein WD942_04810 [Dehalococcoidia bacterium]